MRIGFDAKKAVKNLTGIGNYSRNVINSLHQYFPGMEYVLFAPSQYNPVATERLSDPIRACIHPYSGKLPILYEIWRCRGILSNIRKLRIDLYHGLSNELPIGIQHTNCKSVVTIHDLIFLRMPETYDWLSRTILKYKTSYACQYADKIVAISEQTKRDIISFYHIPPKKIEVIYQGCDASFYQQTDQSMKREIISRYHLPEKFVLSVGTFQERKNQKTIIKSLQYLSSDIHLVLVGKSTPYIEKLRLLTNEIHLSDRVHFLEDVPHADLPCIYQLSSVFVYLSCFEGFGIPVLEALVSHIPVIAAKGSCLEETGGKHSLYCSPDDDRTLGSMLQKVLSDKYLSACMIAKGEEHAKRFSSEQIAKQYMAVYREVLK